MQSPVDFTDIVRPNFVRHPYKLATDTDLRVFRCSDVPLSVASRYRTDLDDTSDPLRSPAIVNESSVEPPISSNYERTQSRRVQAKADRDRS